MMRNCLKIASIALLGLLMLMPACKKGDSSSEPEPQPQPQPQPQELITISVHDIDILQAGVKVEVTDTNVVYFLAAWPQASVDKYLIDHTEKELNESFVNYIVGDSITPEIFAKDFCIKGNWDGTITGLTGNSLYYALAFTYDATTKTVGSRCFRKSFRTRSQGDVQLSFDIDVKDIQDTTAYITITPSDLNVYYFYTLVDSSFVDSYFYGDGDPLRAAQYVMSQYKSGIDEFNEDNETDYNFYDFPYASHRAKKGVDEGVFGGLAADRLYYFIAFKTTQYCDVVTPITVKTFRTAASKN